MENKVLQENIDRIAKYNQELANKILSINLEKSNISLFQNENGEYNIIFNNTLLHSEISAEAEAKKIVSEISEKENNNAIRIIYGLGLGYLPDELSNELNESKIIIYEPNLDILKFVFSIAKIDAIFKKNVFIATNKKELSDLVIQNSNTKTKMTISFLSSYKKLFFDDIKEALNISQKAQGQHFANENTVGLYAPVAILNTFKNLKYIFENSNISDLKDIYKGKTALCLSSGPSLRENIELIKNNQDKFVIFTVNNTLKLLSEYKIKPDFIVNIETGDTSVQFKDFDLSETYLILEGFASNSIFKLNAKGKINYLSNIGFLNPWLRKLLKLEDNLESLGTVSYTTLMAAVELGFEKIILCGQDLAYKNGECYAKGSQFEDLICVYDEKKQKYKIKAKNFKKYYQSFITDKQNEQFAIKAAWYNLNNLNKNIFTVKSQTGENIVTQSGYALFIECFEEAAIKIKKRKPEIQLINSSTGGAQINGFENIKLSEIINELNTVEKIKIKPVNKPLDINIINKEIAEMKSNIQFLETNFRELIDISSKLIKELSIKKIITPNAQKFLDKQEKIAIDTINNCAKKKENQLMFLVGVDIQKIMEKFKEIEDMKTMIQFIKDFVEKLEKYNNVFSIILKEVN